MDVRASLILALVFMLLVIAAIGALCLICLGVDPAFSEDEDDGVQPPHLSSKQNAALREEALRRIAERQNHQQRQRDASARLTRGF